MATTYRVRRQPCSHCGEKVVVVEMQAAAFGAVLRRQAIARVQHADFEPGSGTPDAVDGACRRERPHVADNVAD